MAVVPTDPTSVVATGGLSIAVTVPSTVAVGDRLVAVLANQGTSVTGDYTCTGWTQTGPAFTPSSSTQRVLDVFYHDVTGTEPASYTFTCAGSGGRVCATMFRLPGCAGLTAGPFGAWGTGPGAGTLTLPTVTPTDVGVVIGLARAEFASPNSSLISSGPSGWTDLVEVLEPTPENTGVSRSRLAVYYMAAVSGAASGAASIVYSAGSGAASPSGYQVAFGTPLTSIPATASASFTFTASGSVQAPAPASASASFTFDGTVDSQTRPHPAGSFTTASNSSGSPLVVPKPGGVADGDLLVMFFVSQSQGATADIPTPAGWARVGPPFIASSANFRVSSVFYRPVPVATSETATSYSLDPTNMGSGIRSAVMCMRIVGVNLSSPVLVAQTVATLLSPNTAVMGTGASPGDGMLTVFGHGDIAAGSDGSLTGFGSGFSTVLYTAFQSGGQVIPSDTSSGRTVMGVWAKNVQAGYAGEQASWLSTTSTWTRSGYSMVFPAVSSVGAAAAQFTFNGQMATPVAASASAQFTLTPSYSYVKSWLAGFGYCAHRGGSADWPEETLYAYDQAAAWNPNIALEVSVWQSSDGVWVCSHDQSTSRVFGVNYDIPTTPWSTLSTLTTTVGNQPIARLTDVLDAHANGAHAILVDNKGNQSLTAFYALLASYGGPLRFVVKSYGVNHTGAVNAHNNGYLTWGYYYEADSTHAGSNNMVNNQADWDWLGMDLGATSQAWSEVKGYGKPVLAHIVANQSQFTTAKSFSPQGYMVSGVTEVVPGTGGSSASLQMLFSTGVSARAAAAASVSAAFTGTGTGVPVGVAAASVLLRLTGAASAGVRASAALHMLLTTVPRVLGQQVDVNFTVGSTRLFTLGTAGPTRTPGVLAGATRMQRGPA
jgi:hypothetical protein